MNRVKGTVHEYHHIDVKRHWTKFTNLDKIFTEIKINGYFFDTIKEKYRATSPHRY